MNGTNRRQWVPWRGPNAVRWTLAFALCLFAIAADAVLPPSSKQGWAGSVPAFSGILALVLAVSACPRTRPLRWPWRGPHPVRNTWALVLALVAVVVVFTNYLVRHQRDDFVGEGWTRTCLVIAISYTSWFASAMAATGGRYRWYHSFNRVAWGFFAVSQWWFWYRSLTR